MQANNGRNHFGCDAPFTVTLAGQRVYICAAKDDVAAVYRNSAAFSSRGIMREMYTWMKLTPEGLDTLSHAHAGASFNDLPQPLDPFLMMIEYHRRQMAGDNLEELLYDRLGKGVDASLATLQGRVSLMDVAERVYLHSWTTAYLGSKIWEVSPDFMALFVDWERSNWKWMFQLPEFMARDVVRAKNGLHAALEKYLAVPAAQRRDANYFVTAAEAMLRELGVSEADMAKIFMLHMWAYVLPIRRLWPC